MSDDSELDSGWPPSVIAAAVVVGIVVLLGAVVMTSRGAGGGGGTTGTTTTRPAAGTSTTVPAAKPSKDRGCSGLPVSTKATPKAPETTWTLSGGVAQPVGASFGPTATEGSIHRCFARSPEGAVAAAWTTVSSYLTAVDGPAVVKSMTVGAQGQAKLIAALTETGPVKGNLCQLAGYRILAFTLDQAVIQTASTCPNGAGLVATDMTVEWHEGDWKVRLRPDGAQGTTGAIADLSGFTLWQGVGS